jgi:hypothetical protein
MMVAPVRIKTPDLIQPANRIDTPVIDPTCVATALPYKEHTSVET